MQNGVPNDGNGVVPKKVRSNYFHRENCTEPRYDNKPKTENSTFSRGQIPSEPLQLEPRNDKIPVKSDAVERVPYPNRRLTNHAYLNVKAKDEAGTSQHQPSKHNQNKKKYANFSQKKKHNKQQNWYRTSYRDPNGGSISIHENDTDKKISTGHNFNKCLPSVEDCLQSDSDGSDDPGDMQKMDMMTAVDLDSDRYARYGIHESEMKDYVRTVTFKNSIEHCAERYIKVNCIFLKLGTIFLMEDSFFLFGKGGWQFCLSIKMDQIKGILKFYTYIHSI